MKSQNAGLRVAAAVFAIMAIAQLARLIIRPIVVVSGHVLPLWPSGLALFVLAALSVWMWSLSRTPVIAHGK